MSHENIIRNRQIFHAIVRQHKTYAEVSKEYNISETRIRQIVEHVREQYRPENLPTQQNIPAIEKACKIYKASPTMRGRIYNALANAGYLKRNKWKRLSGQELQKIKNLGPLSIKIILEAQKL